MSTLSASSSPSSDFFETSKYSSLQSAEVETLSFLKEKPTTTAMVYYEGRFGAAGGQAGNDLARYEAAYKVVSFIDDEKTGKDVGKVISGTPNEIPIYRDLGTALAQSNGRPQFLIFENSATAEELSPTERRLLLRALGYGISVATDLHIFLNSDPEFTTACEKKGAVILAL